MPYFFQCNSDPIPLIKDSALKTARFEVLRQAEAEQIHAASMEILVEPNETTQAFKIPKKLVHWAAAQALKQFSLYGNDSQFHYEISPGIFLTGFVGEA